MNRVATSSVASDLLKEFHQNLGGCWKQDTYSGRHCIKTKQVQQWMKTVQDGHASNNLTRLITEVWRPRHNSNFPPSAESVSSGDDCAIIVFSVLLDIGCGGLLDLFIEADIKDATLSITSAEHHWTSLEQSLRRAGVPNTDRVVEAFKKRKWSFCPVIIKRRMHKDYGGECVFPFCKREPANGKGGTAEVFQVLVPAECMAEDLKESLQASRVEYKGKGKFYELALKTYYSQNREMFEWEKNAFAGLEDQKGMLRYISHYSFEEEPSWWTHNILLEFGELDLDEFFAHEFSSPPVRSLEIISFWESLFKIAEALQRIHNLKFQNDGKTHEFYGWHADVKPDNILRVNGEYKLVDFGFTKFIKKESQAIPMEYMNGGTQTYGAPETDQSRFQTRTPHGQTIDTWSFGCVLSRAASWVVLGQQGILQYDFVRKAAIKRLQEQALANQKANPRCPTAHDAFHNGRTVLPEVIQWHNYLRSIVRTSDTISCEVLDLVETKMLLEDPRRRISSIHLCRKLKDIVRLAKVKMEEDDMGREVDGSLLTDLYNFDKAAPANEAQAKEPKPVKSTKTSGRIGKSQRLDNIPPAKTAHRAEMLTEELQIPVPLQASPQDHLSTILVDTNAPNGLHMHESPRPIYTPEDVKPVSPLRLSSTPQINKPAVKTEHKSRRRSDLVGHSYAASSRAAEDADQMTKQVTGFGYMNEPLDDIGGGASGSTSDPFDLRQPRDPEGLSSPEGGATDMVRRDSKLDKTQRPEGPEGFPSTTFDNLFVYPVMPPPPELYDKYDICRVRRELEQTRTLLTRRYRVDKYLQDFIVNRDMFVVDNGSSMLRFWPAATYVLTTLAMKLAPLDDDGLDLVFTSGPQRSYQGQGRQAAKTFANQMEQKVPILPYSPALEVKTDMAETLGVVFDEYLRSRKDKRMTLLVLTDGLWRGTKAENPVGAKIAKFLGKALKGNHMDDRWFSISFIRFGDYPEAITRLNWLDDQFSNAHQVPDMIDHVPWTGPVKKMVLGSFVGDLDEK
ncbi:Protein kinase domain-containing protein isoform 2 [Cladophialophora immunda]|nr:Protein kinase domain-containing protein isoform 2 [Cladophialophora immunda]